MAGNTHASRKWKFGLSLAQYTELLRRQEGKCAGCGKGETRLGVGGVVRNLSVDHSHETGKIRGLLCDDCNNAIGRADDSPELLRRLAAYLEVANTGYEVPDKERANHRKGAAVAVRAAKRAKLDKLSPDALLDELLNS